MKKRKYVHITADSEHCFDFSDFISAVGVTDMRKCRLPTPHQLH